MKIAYIRPHSEVPSAAPPMAFLSLTAYLRQFGSHDYHIIDARAALTPPDIIKEEIKKLKPDLLCLTAFSMEKKQAHEVAAAVKEVCPHTPLIIGGPYATSNWEDALKDSAIDYAVIGEGEVTFKKLVQALEAGERHPEIKGLAYKENGSIRFFGQPEFIENLDTIPMPAWDLVDLEFYFSNKKKRSSMNPHQKSPRSVPLFSSRGCPYLCTYCHDVFGKKLRKRSVEHVMKELIYLKRERNISEIDIIDDIFNLDRPRAKAICDRIVEEKLNIGIAFPNGLRVDQMDEELVDKLKKAGCYRIIYAIESGSPKIQKEMKKNLNLQKAREMITYTNKKGISTGGFFMFGFLNETEEDMRMTAEFAVKSKLCTASFFILQPFPNTEIFNQAIASGFDLAGYPQEHYYRVAHNISQVPIDKIYKIRGEAIRKFYFSFIRFFRYLRTTPFRRNLSAIITQMPKYLFSDNPEEEKSFL